MLPEKLKQGLENAKAGKKSTLQGILALVAALALGAFTVSADGLSGDNAAELAASAGLFLGAFQRIFFSKS